MTQYDEQLKRIQEKLIEAKIADEDLECFASAKHEYQLGQPATQEEVAAFEEKYAITLPGCFRSFITQVGNGGISPEHTAAGPSYGLYKLGDYVNDLVRNNAEKYLKSDCLIYPDMTTGYWDTLTRYFREYDKYSKDDFERESGKLFGGILPLGTQGCTFLYGIVLNGPHTGRVANLDMDRQMPLFAHENNFLDWYERWLDEVIDGTLLQPNAPEFGYTIRGTAETLFAQYASSEQESEKEDLLYSILNKASIPDDIVSKIETAYSNNKSNTLLLEILTKFGYETAYQHLLALTATDLKTALRLIEEYAISHAADWIKIIEQNIMLIPDYETFAPISAILRQTDMDFGQLLLPLLMSPDEDIRGGVINTLGSLHSKKSYLQAFLTGLADKSTHVVSHALGVLYDVRDDSVLPYYKRIAEHLPAVKDELYEHIEGQLARNLRLFNLTIDELLARG